MNEAILVQASRKHKLTRERVLELHDTFRIFDKNGDGLITPAEIGTVLVALGQRPSMKELKALIKSVDTNKSGSLDFDEFLQIFLKKIAADPEKELYEVFCVFDNDKDGFISSMELYQVLHKLGENITQREAILMVREADLNKDGKVDYKEFKYILSGH